jgi:hypothetical protein
VAARHTAADHHSLGSVLASLMAAVGCSHRAAILLLSGGFSGIGNRLFHLTVAALLSSYLTSGNDSKAPRKRGFQSRLQITMFGGCTSR